MTTPATSDPGADGDPHEPLRGRLAELGLVVGPPVAVKGRYAPAVADGGRVWVSGHTGRGVDTPALAGTVGADVSTEQARASARAAVVNLLLAATAATPLERLTGVVSLRGYVRATPDYTEHPAVIDAASEVLAHVLGGSHARAAIGVASLPGGACVELEAVFARRA